MIEQRQKKSAIFLCYMVDFCRPGHIYAPIKIVAPLPPTGLHREKAGHLTCFDTKTCSIGMWEFD